MRPEPHLDNHRARQNVVPCKHKCHFVSPCRTGLFCGLTADFGSFDPMPTWHAVTILRSKHDSLKKTITDAEISENMVFFSLEPMPSMPFSEWQ